MPSSAAGIERVQASEPAIRADLAAGWGADPLRGDCQHNHFTVIELLADPQSAMTARVAAFGTANQGLAIAGRAKSTQADAAKISASRTDRLRWVVREDQDRGDDADRRTAKDTSDAVMAGRRRTIANHKP